MINLSDPQTIKKLDPQNTFDSTAFIPDQCLQVWNDGKSVSLPEDYKKVNNIVVAGMGGSAYAGYIIQSFFKDALKIPVIINSDYQLPEFVNQDTLVIVTSYSGNTEESLINLKDAKKKKAKILGVTSGGRLAKAFEKAALPCFVFNPELNYAAQPRLGIGYLVFGTMILLKRLQFLSLTDSEVKKAVDEVKNNLEAIKKESRTLAPQFYEKTPIIFAAEFLTGNLINMRNLFNETAKNFSAVFPFPDLNHHLMEGLQNPSGQKLFAFFISSDHYSDIIKKRIALTKDVLKKNQVSYVEYTPKQKTKLGQMIGVLSMGAYTTFYLALLYGLNPSRTPWVDYFKEKLSNS